MCDAREIEISVRCSDKLDTCGSGAENGFTTEYVPVAATPMYEMYDTAFLDGNDTDYISSDYSVDCSDYLGQSARFVFGFLVGVYCHSVSKVSS